MVDLLLGILLLFGLALMASAHNQDTINARVYAVFLGMLCWEAVGVILVLVARSKRRQRDRRRQSRHLPDPLVSVLTEHRGRDGTELDLAALDQALKVDHQPPADPDNFKL